MSLESLTRIDHASITDRVPIQSNRQSNRQCNLTHEYLLARQGLDIARDIWLVVLSSAQSHNHLFDCITEQLAALQTLALYDIVDAANVTTVRASYRLARSLTRSLTHESSKRRFYCLNKRATRIPNPAQSSKLFEPTIATSA